MIVLGGAAAIASRRPTNAGVTVSRCRSTPGRTDASQDQTDVAVVCQFLRPNADGFRNYFGEGAQLHGADHACWSKKPTC